MPSAMHLIVFALFRYRTKHFHELEGHFGLAFGFVVSATCKRYDPIHLRVSRT